MNRENATQLLKEYIKNDRLLKHSFAVSACMRGLAERLNEDMDKWEITGILHDLDYEFTKDKPEEHGIKTVQILKENGFNDEEIFNAILAHSSKKVCEKKIEWALYAVDPASGFIVACALMHPSKKIKNIDVDFMKRRFKEKRFAQGADREQIKKCENLGISLDEFFEICLKNMQKIDELLSL